MLSEKGQLIFCEYMLDTAIDQVTYISELLNLAKMRQRIEGYIAARNDDRVAGINAPIKTSASLIFLRHLRRAKLTARIGVMRCARAQRTAFIKPIKKRRFVK